MAFISRWWQFLRERHDPIGISLMVLAFFAANAALTYDPARVPAMPDSITLVGGFLLIWFLFLHMRLFDEVKDYQFDREHNPERPLARGLISLGEFGTITLLVIIAELVLAAHLGWGTFCSFTFTLCFTLLMRQEFFIGDWMRPKLELYAITHTFSASLMGLTIFSVMTGKVPVLLESPSLLFALSNWFVFNVFEFGRKTFGREEERDGVDSYSARLYPWGAVALLLVNLAAGYWLMMTACQQRFGTFPLSVATPTAIISGIVVFSGLYYSFTPSRFGAKMYRGAVTFFLLAYHVAIGIGVWMR